MLRSVFQIAVCSAAAFVPTGVAADAIPNPTWGALAATGQYGFLIGVLAVLLVITLAIRQHVWSFYALMGVLGCFWVAMNEQGAVGFFVHGFAIPFELYMGLTHVVIVALFALAAYACPTDGWRRRVRAIFAILAAINLVLVFASTLFPRDLALEIGSLLFMLGVIAQVVPISTFVTLSGKTNQFARRGAIALGVLVVLSYTLYATKVPALHPALLTRWILTAMILFGSSICLIRVFALQRDRERTLVAAAEAAKREAATNQALLETERNYAEAREVARNRTQDLARASHDIKQPLISLRRNLEIVGRDQSDEVRRQLSDAFDYLDHLTNSYLRNAAQAAAPVENVEPQATNPVGTLLQTIDRMFREEAEAKGLQFDVRPSVLHMSAPPLIVMRVLSNLVSNAIRHTDQGKVVIDAQESDHDVSILVSNSHADALSIDFDGLFAAGSKGGASEGAGLGLAIAREQATSIGLTLCVDIAAQSETPVRFRLSEAKPV